MLRTSPTPLKIRSLATLAAAALLSVAATGLARADGDGMTKVNQVNVAAVPITCSFATPSTTSFSFDISWIDKHDRVYLLADRSHGDPSANNQGGMLSGATTGDILMIDMNTNTVTPLKPPANDPYAGIRCDANANFGGTAAAGRNEITGPNGVFTVNTAEAWVGDAPSYFNPGHTNTAADYASDPCNSSVRVVNLVTRQQTDHINVGGCFRTDEGAFDPDDQVALFANPSEQPLPGNPNAKTLNASPFITLISTKPVVNGNSHPILKQINFDGKNGTVLADGGIEQAVWSRDTGYFYIAVPGNSANPTGGYVAVVDPKHEGKHEGEHEGEHEGKTGAGIHVVKNYALTNCSPNGAALGPDFKLYLGCSGGPQQIIDIRNGRVLAVVSGTTGGCDEVYFNAGDKHFVGACTDNHAPIDNMDIVDSKTGLFDAAINTGASGAHSIASDPVSITNWQPMFQGLCGSGVACVAVYGSTAGNDKRNGDE